MAGPIAGCFGALGRPVRGHRSCLVDRIPDAQVSAAPAQIAVHGGIDLSIRRFWMFDKQRRSRHNLPGLAIAALRHVNVEPGSLQRVRTIGR
jgi:hypothetical protein